MAYHSGTALAYHSGIGPWSAELDAIGLQWQAGANNQWKHVDNACFWTIWAS